MELDSLDGWACFHFRGLPCDRSRATLLAVVQPTTDAAPNMAAFSALRKTGFWNPPTCLSSAAVYSTHKLLRGKKNILKGKYIDVFSLRYYITLISRMLETSCFPNTSHFEIYTVAMLRPFRHWLSFWTPFSSADVWGVNLGAWLSETWELVKAAFKSSDWLKASSLLLLSCGSELHCMLPSPRVKSGSCPHPGPWLWTALLYHLAAFPTQATLLHFLLP